MINKPPINVQDGFFYQLRKENTLVDVVLLSERKRLGRIKRFDKYAVVLEVDGREEMIYKHAIRYILPNARIQHHVYVHPATHSSGPTAGGVNAPPYGAHLRLRADYPLASLPNEGARVVARALQKYGMFLADGGQIALTARSDRSTAAKWDGLLEPRDLSALKVTDFEMVDHGAWLTWSGDCIRNP